MATDPRQTVRDWLIAERRGDADEADRQFSRVAGALPRLQPSASFTAAILRRVATRATAPDIWSFWWMRVAVATAMLAAGVVAASLSPQDWLSAGLASVGTVAWGVGHVWAASRTWISGVLTVWSGLAHAAAVVARLLAMPVSVGLLALNLSAAGLALAALRRLIPVQEN